MPRKIHDRFVKEWMKELLTDFGTVETEVEIAGEVGTIDVLFYPTKQNLYPLEPLGYFGKILAQPSMVEAFRNTISEWDIRNCKGKLWMLEGELRRTAKREGRSPTGFSLLCCGFSPPPSPKDFRKSLFHRWKKSSRKEFTSCSKGRRLSLSSSTNFPKR